MRLKLDVKWELALRPYVDADFIHVTVRDGVVTLRGSVEDQSAVEAAIHNAKEAGAKKVINKLTTEEGHLGTSEDLRHPLTASAKPLHFWWSEEWTSRRPKRGQGWPLERRRGCSVVAGESGNRAAGTTW